MTLDLTARHNILKIGGADWSEQIDTILLSISRLAEGSGLIQCRGTIALVDTATPPWDLDSLLNPHLWRRGTPIELHISDTAGVLWPFPHALQLLEPPQSPGTPAPGQARRIELQVGCALTAADYDDSDGSHDGVQMGSALIRSAIINNLFVHLGVPALVDPILLYPLDYPLPKQQGGYLQQAAQLAYGGLAALWQSASGAVRTEPLERILATEPVPIIERTVGQSEREFEPNQSPIVPKDRILAVGQAVKVVKTQTRRRDRSRSYGQASVVNPALGNGIILLESRDERETISGRRRTRRITVQQPRGLVIPNSIYELLGIENTDELVPTTSSVVEETWLYESAAAGGKKRLVSITEQRPYGAALASWIAAQSPESIQLKLLIDAVRSEQEIFYDHRDRPIRDRLLQLSPIGDIVPEAEYGGVDPTQLVPSQSLELTWQELRKNEFKHVRDERLPVAQANPSSVEGVEDPFAATALVHPPQNGRRVTISNSGQANPPAPDTLPPAFEREEVFLKAEAHFEPGFGEPRPHTVRVPYAVSEQQLQRIAAIEGTTQVAARWGCRFTWDIPDALLQGLYSPNFYFSVVVDGIRKLYRANSLEFGFNRTEAVLSGLGDYLGFQTLAVNDPGAVGVPVSVGSTQLRRSISRSRRTLVRASRSTVYPYPLQLPEMSAHRTLVRASRSTDVVKGAVLVRASRSTII